GPAARWMAPSTPPPPSSVGLAALTMASTSSVVMSASMISMRWGMGWLPHAMLTRHAWPACRATCRAQPVVLNLSCSTCRARGLPGARPEANAISAPDRPPDLGGERLEELLLVGGLGRLPDPFVEPVRVLAHKDTPAVGLDAIENDPGRGSG